MKKKTNSKKQLEFSFLTQATIHQNKESWFSKAEKILGISNDGGWPDSFGQALHSISTSKTITVVSLFSGAGGLDIGFHDAGFKILECNEIVPLFAETLALNSREGQRFTGTKVHCIDIKDYVPEVPHVDFVIGGPPCQTFSAAGARAAGVMGTDDERGELFLEYARILKLLNPKGFLFENVYRIVGAQGGEPWKRIQEEFRQLGYILFWRILDAADYGVPQFRERLIIVGLKEGEFLFPKPTHGPDSSDNRPYYSAGKAVSNIPNHIIKTSDGLSGRHGYLLNDIPPGLNYSFYTERMGHPQPIFAWRSKFSDYLYKADPDVPVRTIKAQGGQYTGPLSWENRYFTIEELKRLQTFPDDYKIVGRRQKVIHQLGNSVPPQLARILGISVMNQVFNVSYPFEICYLRNDEQLGFRKRKSELTDVYTKKAKDAIEKTKTKHEGCEVSKLKDCGSGYITISSDLSYKMQKSLSEDASFLYTYMLNQADWEFSIRPAGNEGKLCYDVHINIPEFFKKEEKTLAIQCAVYSRDPQSLLAVWKVLEYFIKDNFWRDDLVQVFGYYQYKRNYLIDLKLVDVELASSDFWKVAKKITSGDGIGEITTLKRIKELWGLSISDEILLNALGMMKKIGYEIRSHNTNKQIRPGKFLIPYSFASLNERSLQRLTSL